MYVCLCNAVTESAVTAACEQGARTLGDLQEQLGVGTGCGQCVDTARAMLGADTDQVVPNAPACCMTSSGDGLDRSI